VDLPATDEGGESLLLGGDINAVVGGLLRDLAFVRSSSGRPSTISTGRRVDDSG